jgi:uncharacterized protein
MVYHLALANVINNVVHSQQLDVQLQPTTEIAAAAAAAVWVISTLRIGIIVVIIVTTCFVAVPFVLATITVLLQQWSRRTVEPKQVLPASGLYVGRIWHTRYHPIRHAFTYPLFIFGLNFDDIYCDRQQKLLFTSILWPLSLIVRFNPLDHLKNGEGIVSKSDTDDATKATPHWQGSLADRIFRLVSERTKGSFLPNITTHSILLVTHLTYYGYCFNPVSFYYIHDRKSRNIVAIVGEVSNTPWNEMYCYVLHPDSVDEVTAVDSTATTAMSSLQLPRQKLQYTFPKRFHVSPFMEMSYNYEWIFTNFTTSDDNNIDSSQSGNKMTSIHVVNNLRPLLKQSSCKNGERSEDSSQQTKPGLHFSAVMLVHRHSMHPYRIAYYLSMFPIYCMIIQLWIHVQAFILFSKGVAYQPHPTGAETTVSRMIGTAMEPFFFVRDHLKKVSRTFNGKSETNQSDHEASTKKQKAA